MSAHVDDINKRPGLIALLRDAKDRQFEHVFVHTLDRFARNIGVQRRALRRLGDAGVGFASRTEDFDYTSPAGKFMLTTIGGVAELFSDQLAAYVKKGLKERARSGLPVVQCLSVIPPTKRPESPRLWNGRLSRCARSSSGGPQAIR